MFFYCLYGKSVASEIELKQLYTIDPVEHADISIQLSRMPENIKLEESKGKSLFISKEQIWFRNQYANYCIEKGKSIKVWPHEGIALKYLHPFILGYCVSMLFWQKNQEAIHCSCIRWNNEAIIIAGNSGSGKSTLTSRFLEEGCGLIADDVVILNQEDDKVIAYPAFPQQKLCRDAAIRQDYELDQLLYIDEDRDKFSVRRDEAFSLEPANVRAMICLSYDNISQVQIKEITGFQKLLQFHEHLFLYPMFEQYGLPAEDGAVCLRMIEKLTMYQVVRPETGDTCTEQMQKIREKVGAL